MARAQAVLLGICLAGVSLSDAQDQTFVQAAKRQNLVDVQFFADADFQMIHTPWAYYDFPAIAPSACTACTNFQGGPTAWGSALIAYSPTGGEVLNFWTGPGCTGTQLETGGSAPNLPSNYSAASFKICRVPA